MPRARRSSTSATEWSAFAHPLLASGAYAATDPATRRALHAAIAERVSEPEERARHLALAATGPDEAVASALDDAGRRAESRGAPAAAAELFERAAHLTPPGQLAEVGRRTTDAATCAFQSGDSRRAREMLEELIRTTGHGPARARALVRLALVRGYDDDLRAAEGLLQEAIENADGDAELLAEAHNQLAGMLFRLRERLRQAVEHGTAGSDLEAGRDPGRGAGRSAAGRSGPRRPPCAIDAAPGAGARRPVPSSAE